MFHFLTHAVFKALLFLSAGAVTMRLHHEQDIFAMGGLRRPLPAAFVCFLIGAASLAALPVVTAGFFSKEMILGALWAAPSPALWAAGITGALLTAIYSFRLVFTVFFGPVITMASGAYGIRVLLPLVVLAGAALGVGWLETPGFLGGNQILSGFLEPTNGAAATPVISPLIPLTGCLVPLIGIGIAWVLHRRGIWRVAAHRAQTPFERFLTSACGFDAAYQTCLVRPYLRLVAALRHDPVDQLSLWAEQAATALHRRLRATQTGQLRRYAAWMMAGAVATIAMVLLA
jgi:NADH-quinone oxidoreductase subunit L